MGEIVFEKAGIFAIQQVTGKQLTSKVHVVAELNEKSAEALGVRYSLFQRNGVIRFGPKAIELELQYDNAWFSHEIVKIGKLQLVGAVVSKFKAFRIGDGKKKPKRMMLRFVVQYTGAPFELLEHVIKCGRGAGAVTVKPTEEQMNLVPKEEPTGSEDRTEVRGIDGSGQTVFECTVEDLKNAAAKLKAANDAALNYSEKGWSASVVVAECEGGYGVVFRAGSPNRRLPAKAPAVFAIESAAIEHGLNGIERWAEKIVAGGTKPEKNAARKMIEWVTSGIAGVQITLEASAPVAPVPGRARW